MSMSQMLLATPKALLVMSLGAYASLAGADAYVTPVSAGSCETIGNTAPCHCVCHCDGDIVGAKTFTADELNTTEGYGYCSTVGTAFFEAPCVQFCFNHTGSCGNTWSDNPVGMTCTSIGDLPEVTAPLASSALELAAGVPGLAGSCQTVGNTAPCHCICRCDGDVVGAKTFTADELNTTAGEGYCSIDGKEDVFTTAPCVEYCFDHTGSCGNTFQDNPVAVTCTSIGDLPEVSMSQAVSATTGAGFLAPSAR